MVAKQTLNGFRVSSKEELKGRIQFLNEVNIVPTPDHWYYKLNEVDIKKENNSQDYT